MKPFLPRPSVADCWFVFEHTAQWVRVLLDEAEGAANVGHEIRGFDVGGGGHVPANTTCASCLQRTVE